MSPFFTSSALSLLSPANAAMNGSTSSNLDLRICKACNQRRDLQSFMKGDKLLSSCLKCRTKNARTKAKSKAKRPPEDDGHQDAARNFDRPSQTTGHKRIRLAGTISDANEAQIQRYGTSTTPSSSQPASAAPQNDVPSPSPSSTSIQRASIRFAEELSTLSPHACRTETAAQTPITDPSLDTTLMQYQPEDERFAARMNTPIGTVLPSPALEDAVHQVSIKERGSIYSVPSRVSRLSRASFSKIFRSSRNGSLGETQVIDSTPSITSSFRHSIQTICSSVASIMAAPMLTAHNKQLIESRQYGDPSRAAISALGPHRNNRRDLRKAMFNCAILGDVDGLELVLATGKVSPNDALRAEDLGLDKSAFDIAGFKASPKMSPLEVAVKYCQVDVVTFLLRSGMLSGKTLQAAAVNFRPTLLSDVRRGSVSTLSLLLAVGAVAGNLSVNDSELLIKTAVGSGKPGLHHLFKTTAILKSVAFSCRQSCKSYGQEKVFTKALFENIDNDTRKFFWGDYYHICRTSFNNAMLLMLMLSTHDKSNFYLIALIQHANLMEHRKVPREADVREFFS